MTSLPNRLRGRGSPAKALASGQIRATSDGPRRVRSSASIGHSFPSCRCASSPRPHALPARARAGPRGRLSCGSPPGGNDSRLKLTQQAVDAFTAANPDIKVTVENSDWTAYWDKLATMTAGNNAPDVIQMDESYIAAYGAREALLDLNTVKGNLDLSTMDPKVLETGNVEGTLVGAPIGVANFSVAANPEVLKKAGVSVPNDKTWSWDQFAEGAAQVAKARFPRRLRPGRIRHQRCGRAHGRGRRVRKSGPPTVLESAKQPSPASSTTPTSWWL